MARIASFHHADRGGVGQRHAGGAGSHSPSSSSSSSGSTVNSATVSRIKQLMNNGKSRDDVIYQLIDEGYSNTEIEQFLNAVGIY